MSDEQNIAAERVAFLRAFRRFINKLAQILAFSDIDPEMHCRASGDCVCELCGEPYWRHAVHPHGKWLVMLCDGRNVHL